MHFVYTIYFNNVYFCFFFLKFGDRSHDILEAPSSNTFVAPSSSVEWKTVTQSGKNNFFSLFLHFFLHITYTDKYNLFLF